MSDDDYTPEDEPPQEDRNIRTLREKAKRADTLAEDNAAKDRRIAELERANAFRDAGINPSDPKAKYFVKGYDGEMDAATIKAEAEAAGLLTVEAPAPESPPQGELDAFDRFGQAAAGAEGGGQPPTWETELVEGMSGNQIAEVLNRHGRPVTGMGQFDPSDGTALR